MGLRSGLILPFQFRETKKLLMIGGADEERDLDVFDLKNVVRAAFGIYNFEFRNKKIGFNIPDDLFLQYISQRRDLTNFVIEILQAQDEINCKEPLLSFEPSCSSQQQQSVGTPNSSHKNNIDVGNDTTTQSASPSAGYSPNATSQPHASDHHHHHHQQQQQQRDKTASHLTNNSEHSNEHEEPPHKLRIGHPYHVHTPESLTQSIDPMDIMPKWEQQEEAAQAAAAAAANVASSGGVGGNGGVEGETKRVRYFAREQAMQHAMQHHQQMQQQQLQQQHHQQQQQHFFPTYNPALITNSSGASSTMQLLGQHHPQTPSAHQQQGGLPPPPPPPSASEHPHPPQTPYTPGMMNRFRRRGERMSKDQKELYVKYFEENPCMLTQRRNDIMLEPHWFKLCTLLNSVPQGAVKNVEEWKQTFDAWRYRVFMYTRYNYKLSGAAAQNPKNYKPLTTTDQRAYAMWTSHKGSVHDFDKMEMFGNLDDTQSAE